HTFRRGCSSDVGRLRIRRRAILCLRRLPAQHQRLPSGVLDGLPVRAAPERSKEVLVAIPSSRLAWAVMVMAIGMTLELDAQTVTIGQTKDAVTVHAPGLGFIKG